MNNKLFKPNRSAEESLAPGYTFSTVTEDISRIVESKPPQKWWLLFGVAFPFYLYY